MKRKITKAEYEALSAEMKVLYVAEGDSFILPLTDYEDAGEMRRARDREKVEGQTAKTALATALAELEALKLDPARKTGDIKTLEASWEGKLNAEKSRLELIIGGLKKTLERTLIDHATAKIAGSITGKPEHATIMEPHINRRLEIVYDGELPTVKVKDATGRISALNFDELGKELVANPLYGTLVVGSKASGGGAGGHGGGAGGGAGKKLSELSESDRVALYRADPAAYKARRDAEKA